VNGVAKCRPPVRWRQLTSAQPIRYQLKCVTRSDLRVPTLVDVCADALHGRDARVGARGFEAVEAEAIDRLERKLVLKTRLGTGIELSRGRDSALAIQVRAVTLKTQGPGSPSIVSIYVSIYVSIRPNDIGSSGSTRRLPLQSGSAWSAQHLRASAFQLSAWKANPLVLCELTVFLCHGSQSNRCL